jgi:membrane protein DedA with SNARE-associated domain
MKSAITVALYLLAGYAFAHHADEAGHFVAIDRIAAAVALGLIGLVLVRTLRRFFTRRRAASRARHTPRDSGAAV